MHAKKDYGLGLQCRVHNGGCSFDYTLHTVSSFNLNSLGSLHYYYYYCIISTSDPQAVCMHASKSTQARASLLATVELGEALAGRGCPARAVRSKNENNGQARDVPAQYEVQLMKVVNGAKPGLAEVAPPGKDNLQAHMMLTVKVAIPVSDQVTVPYLAHRQAHVDGRRTVTEPLCKEASTRKRKSRVRDEQSLLATFSPVSTCRGSRGLSGVL